MNKQSWHLFDWKVLKKIVDHIFVHVEKIL